MKNEVVLSLFILLASCGTNMIPSDLPVGGDGIVERPSVGENEKELPPNVHQLHPDSQGRLNLSAAESSKILPGDTVYLRGHFKSVRIEGLKGSESRPIRVANYPGESLVIGDENWSGGAYSNALQLRESSYVVLGSEESGALFRITGSTNPQASGGYIGISLQPFTDNMEVKNISISHGGVGIMSKTDPQQNDPKTWHPNTLLQNLSIHDVTISGVRGVAMYIGHTSIHWGWDENGKGYSAGVEPTNPSHTIVKPVRWKNVAIYNNKVISSGMDGIQVSSTDRMEIYENKVGYFGLYQMFGQSIGILVGGNSTNTHVHDNRIFGGFGEAFQFHGAGRDNSTHVVNNNLITDIQAGAMGIYGLTDDATITISNNTVARCLVSAIVVNGRGKKTLAKLHNNVFIACHLKIPNFIHYIKAINGGVVEQSGRNLMFYSAGEAKIDSSNSYAPLPGSEVNNEGFTF